MESTDNTKVEVSTEVSKKKTYPHDEEDIKYEQELIEAIKKLDIEKRYQFISLNNLVLKKKQQDLDLDNEMKGVINAFNKIQEPVTQSGDQIIGGRALNEEELSKIKANLTDEEISKIVEVNQNEAIPKYWYTAILNCAVLTPVIEDHDKPILEHLTQIDYKTEEENDDFTVIFHFSANEYFENTSLSVKFFLANENEAEKAEATEIKWKEGKNVTKKTVSKKQKNKKTGKTREIKKEVDADSFFNLFKTIDIEKEGEDADDEEGDAMIEKLDTNFQTAKSVGDELLPYHLEYFLGIREPSEDGMDDDEIPEDDEDLDDDDDDDEPPKKTKNKKNKDGEAPKEGEPKQECKQQ